MERDPSRLSAVSPENIQTGSQLGQGGGPAYLWGD